MVYYHFRKSKKADILAELLMVVLFNGRNVCKSWTLGKELSYTVKECNLLLSLAGSTACRPLVSHRGLFLSSRERELLYKI